MKKVIISCILTIAAGLCLFVCSYLWVPTKNILFEWCIGLACALIILGVGFLIGMMHPSSENSSNTSVRQNEWSKEYSKEKAGYLVSKIVSILLCIYILLLEKMLVSHWIILVSISLLVVQYLLNLLLYLHFSRKKDN